MDCLESLNRARFVGYVVLRQFVLHLIVSHALFLSLSIVLEASDPQGRCVNMQEVGFFSCSALLGAFNVELL